METLAGMRNWRSSISGAITSAAGLVLALSSAGVTIPKWVVVMAGFVMAGGFASLGVVSKDAATHSTLAEVRTATATVQQVDEVHTVDPVDKLTVR